MFYDCNLYHKLNKGLKIKELNYINQKGVIVIKLSHLFDLSIFSSILKIFAPIPPGIRAFFIPKNQTETESDVVGRDFMHQLQKTNERR